MTSASDLDTMMQRGRLHLVSATVLGLPAWIVVDDPSATIGYADGNPAALVTLPGELSYFRSMSLALSVARRHGLTTVAGSSRLTRM